MIKWSLTFQLLLALLGALVQDKYREQFIQPAFNMEERSQMELKAMIESVLFANTMGTNLPVGFDDVLKRRAGKLFFLTPLGKFLYFVVVC